MTPDSVLSAGISQSSSRYSSMSRGKQCVANCLIFLCLICVKGPFRFCAQDLHYILDLGDMLYSSIYSQIHKDLLLVSDLPQSVFLETTEIKGYFRFASCQSYTGCMNEGFESDIGFSLEDSFHLAHARNQYVHDKNFILVFHSSAVGIAAVGNYYYLFDPHCRGKDGLCSGNGTCTLSTFCSLQKLCSFVRQLALSISRCNLCDTQFELHLVNVSRAKRIELPVQFKLQHPTCRNLGNPHSQSGRVRECPFGQIQSESSADFQDDPDQSSQGIVPCTDRECSSWQIPLYNSSATTVENELCQRSQDFSQSSDSYTCSNEGVPVQNTQRSSGTIQYHAECDLFVPQCYIFLCMSCIRSPDILSEVEMNDIQCVSQIFYKTFIEKLKKEKILVEDLPGVLKLEMRDLKAFFQFKVINNVQICLDEDSIEHAFVQSISTRGLKNQYKKFVVVFQSMALGIVEIDSVYYIFNPQNGDDTCLDEVCVRGIKKIMSLQSLCTYLKTVAYSFNGRGFHLYQVYVSSPKQVQKAYAKMEKVEISYKWHKSAVELFKKSVSDGPTYICSCCSQTCFKEQVSRASNIQDKYDLAAQCLTGKESNGSEWICKTCNASIMKGKVPACSLYNGMGFPEKPPELDLTALEERLISPRIPFMQISEKPRGGQRSLRGNIVNVPTDVTTTVTSLPRCLTDSETIQVHLKRKLNYKHSYMHESVRPKKCIEALHWLLENSEIFQSEGIHLNTSWNLSDEDAWLGNLSSNTVVEEIDRLTDSSALDMAVQQTTESTLHTDQHYSVGEESVQCSTESTQNTDQYSSVGEESVQCSTEYTQNTDQNLNTREESDGFSEIDDFDTRFTGNTDTVMHPVNAVLVDKEYSFAPGEGQTPLGLLQDAKSEYLSFPSIHCGKARMPDSERFTPVHFSMLYSWEMRSSDRRAATCIPYLFYILRKFQIKQIQSQAQLVVRKCVGGNSAITAKDVLQSFDTLVRMNQGYRILKSIRGSPPYWESAKKDLFAMIRQLGIPTWFCSFSAAETKWTCLLRILAKLNLGKDCTDDELNSMSWLDKCALIKKDPVTCARYFSHRFNTFFTSFLKGRSEPLGKIADFFYRVEFQHRGSPHIHALLWIQDAPKYTEHGDSGEAVASFIDKHITCKKNTDISDLVNYQTHRHARTCRKKGKAICRFGFPIPPMPVTRILVPLTVTEKEENTMASANYEKLVNMLKCMQAADNVTFPVFLDQIDLSENEYILALRSSLSSPKVFLKRECSEIRVNSYSEMALRAWEANIDVQFVLDSYACAAYIVSYISKGQRGMSELLSQACKEAKEGISSLKQQVRHIGNKFLTHVEIGSQEAAFLILHMPLRMSSRSTVFISTFPASERGFLLKPVDLLEKMDQESTDIEADNNMKRYQRRPSALDDICLADFMALYDISKKKGGDDSSNNRDDDGEHETGVSNVSESEMTTDSHSCERYTLSGGLVLKKRQAAKIIRFVGYTEMQDPENHFREQLMLFFPWRNEVEDLQGQFQTYGNSIEDKHVVVARNKTKYCSSIDLEQILDEAVLNDFQPTTSVSEAQHLDELDRESDICRSFGCFDPHPQEQAQQYDISMDIGITRKQFQISDNIVHEMTNNDYLALARRLNARQKLFFYHVLHWFKTKEQPMYCFLSGGAGVGKSVVVEAVYQALVRHWKRDITESQDDAKVLLCAPTGKAAHNIHGHTIHSLFCIPANQSFSYKPLDSEQLDSMRVKFQALKVIVIDEISMVGQKMFNYINLRLQEIFGNGKLFGGISLIAVGDLFQLKPVMDGWIFKDLAADYGPLATNLWTELFQFYELTEIMRQKDDCAFAELLNRLREGKHRDEDVIILKDCVVPQGSEKLVRTKPHLYTTNKEVDKFNTETYENVKTRKCVIEAIDIVSSDCTQAAKEKILNTVPVDPCKTAGLLKAVMIAETLQADLCLNIDVSDGLANGASCIVKKLDFRVHGSVRCSIVWVLFHDCSIGKGMRNKFRHLYRDGIQESWTPLLEVTRKFTVGRHHSSVITRRQFPIRLAAAKTIHKSQGSTMKEAVLHFGSRQQDHMHYVGLSRIQCLSDVHILHFNEGKISVSKDVQQEMERLRKTCIISLCYPTLNHELVVKILYHNTRSLHMHIKDLRAEKNMLLCDIIAVSESRLIESDENEVYDLPGYNMYRFDSVQNIQECRPSKGFVVYSKIPVQNITPQTELGIDTVILQLPYEHEQLFIVFVYCSPHLAVVNRMKQLFTTVKSHVQSNPVIIMGDFNMDILACLGSFLKEHAFNIHLKSFTTDYKTKIDQICDANFRTSRVSSAILESYYSDHKPIVASIISHEIEAP